MKVKICTLMLLVSSFISFSQTEDLVCGYNDSEVIGFNQESSFSHSTDPNILYAKEPKVFNVFFWQVNRFNGQFGDDTPNQETNITEDEVLSAIANLNINFNKYNLFFKYQGLGEFNSPETVYVEEEIDGYCNPVTDNQGNYIIDENGYNTLDNECQFRRLIQYTVLNEYMLQGTINIFIPYATKFYRAVGHTSPPSIIIKREDFANKILIHEMGHVLYLRHTHRGHRDLGNPINPNYEDCEHVTRAPLLPDGTVNLNYNAELKGDLIVDTAAAPDFLFENYYELLEEGQTQEQAKDNYTPWLYIDVNSCEYIGVSKDCLDVEYDIFPKDSKNIMSYTRDNCREIFTVGQAIRMHEIVELWPSNFEPLAQLQDLFEPYKGEYYVAGPLPPNYQSPLFQPGFDYLFVECDGDYTTPAVYSEMFYNNPNNVLLSIGRNETSYDNITHPNHSAIKIKHTYGNFLDKPEKCYNNWNRNPSGGLITKFNDDVFNANVTLTAQDSTSINSQNLIENLGSGLYKIEKNYEDGSTQETILFKENN